jgi:hypothetical protein
MIRFLACIALLCPVWACSAPEAGRYQQGRVSQIEKTPCFSVADTLETRAATVELAMLEVNQITDGKYTPVWSIEFVKESPASQLSPSACIPYGYVDEVSTKARKLPQPLRLNQPYAFFFNAFVPKEQGKGLVNRVYRGNFCLVLDEFQQPKVRQVVYDAVTGEWLWNVCNVK